MKMLGLAVAYVVLATSAMCSEACLEDQERLRDMGVKYGSTEVVYNNIVNLDIVVNAPSITATPDPSADDKLLLVMVDPDAPSAAKCPATYFLHWMQVSEMKEPNQVKNVTTVVEYFKPTPPPGSGPHRYQFMLYQLENGKAEGIEAPERSPFNLTAFAEGLGFDPTDPVASFQFRAENSG